MTKPTTQTTLEDEEKARLERLEEYDSDELLNELRKRLKWYSGMEYRFACVLDYATGGRMSKTNYEKEAMYAQINDRVNKIVEEAIQEEKENV